MCYQPTSIFFTIIDIVIITTMPSTDKIDYYGGCGSFSTGQIPEGCKRCLNGEKAVIYVTGRCKVGCFYCTIPQKSKSKSVIRVNEIELDIESNYHEEIVAESSLSMATGAGITGGDPLATPERTINIISHLKSKFGEDYHIHLYTSGYYGDIAVISRLIDVGLDEIRFHPKDLNDYKSMKFAQQVKNQFSELTVGFEIPAIPGRTEDLKELINFAERAGLNFVNLNEFEFTEENFPQLEKLGFVSDLHSSAVLGSAQISKQLLQTLADEISIPLHFCSSASKDRIQLTNRFKKRASQVARPFESISDEGELEYSKLTLENHIRELYQILIENFNIPPELLELNEEVGIIETSWIILDEIFEEIKPNFPNLKAEIICRHPVEDGPITYVNQL